MDKVLILINNELSRESSIEHGTRAMSIAQLRSSLEFEIRLGKIDIASYAKSLEILRAAPHSDPRDGEEKSLSVLSHDDAANLPLVIRKIHPVGSTVTMHKTEIAKYIGNTDIDSTTCGFKIALSRESIVNDAQSPKPSDKVRLRIRNSRMIEIDGRIWSADVTLICESTYGQMLSNKRIKTDFFDTPEHKGAQHYEVEFELHHRGTRGSNITSSDVMAIVARACSIAYPNGINVGISKSPRELTIRSAAQIINRAKENMGHNVRHARATPRALGQSPSVTLKGILNNAVSLTKSVYLRDVHPMVGYYATDKADGERGLAIIDSDKHIAVVTDTQMYGHCDVQRIANMYDGEVITDAPSSAPSTSAPEAKPQKISFYAFDCLWSDGKSMMAEHFIDRISEIEESSDGDILISVKEFFVISVETMRKTIEDIYNRADRPYPIDGLIFTQPDADYVDTKNYKWKPMRSNTIDFLCLRCPEKLYGHSPYVLPQQAISVSASEKGRSDFRIYLLYCSCSEQQRKDFRIERLAIHDEIVPPGLRNDIIQFEYKFEPLAYILVVRMGADLERFGGDIHGRVVEMRWRITQHDDIDESPMTAKDEPWRRWDMLRVRPDRVVGNNIAVAASVFVNYVDPFPLEALWEPTTTYFEKGASEIFRASNKFRRFILTMVIYNELRFTKKSRILDLGGGLEEDFPRYVMIGASGIVNFDIDAMAITVSVARVEEFARSRRSASAHMPMAEQWIANLTKEEQAMAGNSSRPARAISPPSGLQARENMIPTYIGRVVDVTKLTQESLRSILLSLKLDVGIFDAVVSTFAFHHFCRSRETVERVFSIMNLALNDSGIIIITTMNGERVFDLMKRNGGVWKRSEPDTNIVKYEIRALYSAEEQSEEHPRGFGQMIRVSVPFSDEMRDEPLCNFSAVREVASAAGFSATNVTDYGAEALFAMWRVADPRLSRETTMLDREYTNLFSTIVFKKTPPLAEEKIAPKRRAASRVAKK